MPPPNWINESDNPDALPERGSPDLPPEVFPAVANLERPTYARVRELVSEKGVAASRKVLSEMPWLGPPADYAFVRTKDPKPAMRDRQPVAAEIEYFLVFNPASASLRGATATPRLVLPASVALPGAATKAEHVFVEFEFSIRADGSVASIKPVAGELSPALIAAAEASAPRWKFAPARSAGQAAASTVVVPVLFLNEPPEPADSRLTEPVQIVYQRPPVYPMIARRAGAPGRVVVQGIVDVEGRVRDLHVLESSHRVFERAAIEAISTWRFRPARKDGVPVNSEFTQPIHFQLGEDAQAPGTLTVRRDADVMKKLPPELQWDEPPQYTRVTTAVYPFEALAANKKGSVRLAFVVGPNGRVVESKALDASAPEFAGAALAMLDKFLFLPASKQGKPSSALLSLELEFDRTGNVLVARERETVEFIRRLEKERDSFARARDIDGGLIPRNQTPPVFPLPKRDASEGESVVEFVIDHEGVVHAPRVVSASAPEFGFSAVQAIASWRFAPPKKHGKPVDVIARMPVKFKRGN